MNLLATVALLEMPGGMRREHQGYVLVLENATELLRAQKQSAWKEVARRVAHEIKNPLTPISLSAEQIRRHIDRLAHTLEEHAIESPSTGVIRRCSEVITSSVESMRSLVDQFSALAEFPTAKPKPADLNTIVENSLALFAGRMQTIRVVKKMSPGSAAGDGGSGGVEAGAGEFDRQCCGGHAAEFVARASYWHGSAGERHG